MNVFSVLGEWLGRLPAWCVFVPPAVSVGFAVVLFFFRARRIYLWLAALSFVAGMLLSVGLDGREVYLALFAGVGLLPLPLFRIPKRHREEGKAERKLYERFRPELEQPLPARRDPPKVCCFEEPTGETVEERGMKLSHVISLLDKLKREKLTPADRLEVEMLSRSVTGAETRPLTDSQTDELSDCLSAVLRLTAKYS